jgi:hypothetical protein
MRYYNIAIKMGVNEFIHLHQDEFRLNLKNRIESVSGFTVIRLDVISIMPPYIEELHDRIKGLELTPEECAFLVDTLRQRVRK